MEQIRTLAELFLATAKQARAACLMHKVDGRYVAISTETLTAAVCSLARALEAAGIRKGDRVALMAENGPHWPTVDFAVQLLGAVLVPIYPTLLPEGVAYIVRDSGARLLFVQGPDRLVGLRAVLPEMPGLERMIALDETAEAGATTLERFLAGSDAAVDSPEGRLAWIEERCREVRADDLATLIYTSGTTGDPKGVMLTHANLVSNVTTSARILGAEGDFVALSFLPLSHSFERTVDYTYFLQGMTIAYAESVQTVAQNLLEVRPHVFVAVPRVYEKVMARVVETATAGGGLRSRLFRWALRVGRQSVPERLAGRPPGLRLRWADRLVFSRIRARLGGRFVFALSGGAPLAREVAEFFWGAGLPIYEGYGLTETSPVISVNVPGAVKLGTVGRPIPGVEVRISEDGEILSRGPNIMRGYFGSPDATAEVLADDGWFHTGDIGHLDADGFLVITDRKKEIIVNAYGKNIAPAPIENALTMSRWIAQAVVVGDERQFLGALLVPDFEVVKTWGAENFPGVGLPALLERPELRQAIADDVERINQRLARFERIGRWELLDAEFSIEGGELTPKLSVKRRVVAAKYKDRLDRLFASPPVRKEP
ncbi:MAG: long-chain fatty acid--CoA ligase [Thermoanaerobaculia bacterium]